MKLKTLKDIETLDMKERAFANSIRQEVIKRINYLESLGTICHRWVANEWRTFIDYKERQSKPTKAEKKWMISTIKRMVQDYNITNGDLND